MTGLFVTVSLCLSLEWACHETKIDFTSSCWTHAIPENASLLRCHSHIALHFCPHWLRLDVHYFSCLESQHMYSSFYHPFLNYLYTSWYHNMSFNPANSDMEPPPPPIMVQFYRLSGVTFKKGTDLDAVRSVAYEAALRSVDTPEQILIRFVYFPQALQPEKSNNLGTAAAHTTQRGIRNCRSTSRIQWDFTLLSITRTNSWLRESVMSHSMLT